VLPGKGLVEQYNNIDTLHTTVCRITFFFLVETPFYLQYIYIYIYIHSANWCEDWV
jgi:hypothetical protein